jgi:3-hydroxyacyl-[acyl-carrier protein] dehydratase/trans-2-decenoyl-[acyl-carrier protein] isomerase
VAVIGFYLLWEGNSQELEELLGSGQVKFYGQVLPKAKIVEYEISIKRIRKQKLVGWIC